MQLLPPLSSAACAMLASILVASPVLAEPVKVAFIGDQGIYIEAQQVLELIRDEGAELLLVQGDLGYDPNRAGAWINNMDSILGKDFPVLMVVGNHENYEWPAYLQWQKDKLARQDTIRCEGDISVKAYCTYKGIGVVQVAPGITEVEGINGNDNYADYITEKFESDDSTWRICSWHKNMRDMQTGSKSDATGWAVYQSCLAQGGLVMTGHEHAYSRTHLMSNFQTKTVIHRNSEMEIGPRSSLAFVSGLGGRGIRPQLHHGDWFASVYTADQNANNGALFCTFENNQADCYMKDVAGLVPDTFSLTSTREQVANVEQTETDTEVVEEPQPETLSEEQSEAGSEQLNEASEPPESDVQKSIEAPVNTEQESIEPSEPPENSEQEPVEPSETPENTEQEPVEPSETPENTEQESVEPSETPENTEQESVEPSEPPENTEQEPAQAIAVIDNSAPGADATTGQLENNDPRPVDTANQSSPGAVANTTQQAQVEVQQQSAEVDDAPNQNPVERPPTSTVDNGQTALVSGNASASLVVANDNVNASNDVITDRINSSASRGGGLVHWLALLSLFSVIMFRRRH